MTAFHLNCDAVVNLHKKKVTLHCKITKHKIFMSQSRASVDRHAMLEAWGDDQRRFFKPVLFAIRVSRGKGFVLEGLKGRL